MRLAVLLLWACACCTVGVEVPVLVMNGIPLLSQPLFVLQNDGVDMELLPYGEFVNTSVPSGSGQTWAVVSSDNQLSIALEDVDTEVAGNEEYGFVLYGVKLSKDPQVFSAALFSLEAAVIYEQLLSGPFTVTANLVQGLNLDLHVSTATLPPAPWAGFENVDFETLWASAVATFKNVNDVRMIKPKEVFWRRGVTFMAQDATTSKILVVSKQLFMRNNTLYFINIIGDATRPDEFPLRIEIHPPHFSPSAEHTSYNYVEPVATEVEPGPVAEGEAEAYQPPPTTQQAAGPVVVAPTPEPVFEKKPLPDLKGSPYGDQPGRPRGGRKSAGTRAALPWFGGLLALSTYLAFS